VLVTHGYTDLVTPYGVSQDLIDQLAPLDGARPIALKVYRGGHMMYLRPASRRALSEDARAFYVSVLSDK
jgi:carboxypeptidase C (cathepsin A)